MISKESGFSILALTALVSLTSWMAIKNSEIPPDTGVITQTGLVKNLKLHQTNQFGQLSYVASADLVTQYSNGNNNVTNLSAIAYNQNNTPPWHLTAPEGQTLNNNAQIVLSGGVNLYREASKNYNEVRVETQSATIYPQQNYAETTYPISIFEPGTSNITTAVGAKAYFKTEQVVLLSQVNSVYEPKVR